MQFSLLISRTGMLVIMIAVGFVCARLKVTDQTFSKKATPVIMNVLLPCTILASSLGSTLSMTPLLLLKLLGFIGLMFAICIAVGFATPKLLGVKDGREGLCFFAVSFMNTVFVAFPIIEAIYGDDGILYASVSNVFFNLLLYTLGIARIKGGKEKMPLRSLFTPPLIATLIGIVVSMTGLHLPAVLTDTLSAFGKAAVPMFMLIIGTSLGLANLGRLLSDWRVYAISALRLVICPLLVWAILRFIIKDAMLLGIIVILASAPAPAMMPALAIQYDRDEQFSSACVVISTVLSALTMPLLIWLLL